MKKKGLKILTAAAVLSLGILSMNAYAAEGWAMSNNSWVYVDNNGNRVTNEWRKGADNLWRYLDGSGVMAINCWVDGGDYYVDSNGIMMSNKWLKTRSYYDSYGDEVWFYCGSSGKIVKDGWKKIDGKNYLFDSDGVMQTGWSDDGLYYLGDANDGSMKTGWKYLEPPEKDDDDYAYGPENDDGMYWYYFSAAGKKYCPSTGDNDGDYRVAKIDNKYYCFDENGRMQTGWVYMEGDSYSASSSTIEGWRYFAEEGIKNATLGAAISGWLSLEPPEPLQMNADEMVVWYYFSKDGVPKIGPEEGEASTNDFLKVDGKYYLFNQVGNPVKGLCKVQIGNTGEYTSYYFDASSRTPVKGKRTVEEGDGNKSTFCFNEGTYAGRGVTGVKSNYLYYMGKLQKADSDTRYILVSIPANDGYNTYVVNTSGRVSKNTTVKDRDGNKYKVNASGIVTEINGEAAGKGNYGEPVEPVFDEFDY